MLGAFNAAPRSTTDEAKDYQDLICLGRKGGRFSQRRRAKLRAKQGEVGRGGTPAREISFVSLVAYGPNSDSALTMGGYSL